MAPWQRVGIAAAVLRPAVVDVHQCEDYALVALSWAVTHDCEGIGLGFCWKPPYPWPRHVIAFDEDRVYSSGRLHETSVDEGKADSRYSLVLRRHVNVSR